MSISLNKSQKIIVICSIAWTIISLLAANNAAYSEDSLPLFFLFILPVMAYWAGVWIWGFGSFSKACKYIAMVSTSKNGRKIVVGVVILAIIIITTILKFEDIENYIHLVERKNKAEQGDAGAQNSLATNYAVGSQGVTKDTAEAVKWYIKAAMGGNEFAQFELFQRFIDGNGLPVDYIKAYMWMNILQTSDSKNWGDLPNTAYGRHLMQKISPEQITEGQRLAREWENNHLPTLDEFFGTNEKTPLPKPQAKKWRWGILALGASLITGVVAFLKVRNGWDWRLWLTGVGVWLSVQAQAKIGAIATVFIKIWRAQYSLRKLLVGFFIFGGLLFPFILLLPFILTNTYDHDMLRPILMILFIAYRIVTTVGVWRGANMLAATYYRPGSKLGVSVPFRAFMIKLFVCIWIMFEISRSTGLKAMDVMKYIFG